MSSFRREGPFCFIRLPSAEKRASIREKARYLDDYHGPCAGLSAEISLTAILMKTDDDNAFFHAQIESGTGQKA